MTESEPAQPGIVKRFYKTVRVEETEDGLQLYLDGRPAKTRSGKPVTMVGAELATAIHGEWDAQGETLDFFSMPMTRLQMALIDGNPGSLPVWRQEILRYLTSDLVCYRADGPAGLKARQCTHWDPVLDRLAQSTGIRLGTTTGVTFLDQSTETIATASDHLSQMRPPALLAAVQTTQATGSAALALAGVCDYFPVTDLIAAAFVDEDFQAERWGIDVEAAARRATIEDDIRHALRFANIAIERTG